jgi:single-stranded-DNA-specific exonuclease
MPIYRWPTDEKNELEDIDGVSPLLATLLKHRSVESGDVEDVLTPSYDRHLHDPLLLNDIEPACTRIESALAQNEHVAVFADYDCDGIPGAVVAHDFFEMAGHETITFYIPHRHYEGFGLSPEAVDKLHTKGVKLIITIDCGVTDVAAVARANELGIDVIITDHHEPGEELPAALAIVNPKLGEYPFSDLCGAAVIWKLATALVARGDYGKPAGYEKWWLDMVGVATIADMVPLVGENRVLATYGLMVLRKSRRPGLQQLLKKAKADQRYLTEEDIGFTIGPRVNAASRMDTPEDAFRLLTANSAEEAGTRVTHLEELNQQRKTAVAQMTKDVHKRVSQLTTLPDVLVFGDPAWRPSLVGLTAGKLADEHGRPAFVWGRDGNGAYKGSCRSGGNVSVVELLRAIPEHLHEHGGHHVAGGFTVSEESIHEFPAALAAAYKSLGATAVVEEEVVVDALLTLDEVTKWLYTDMQKLAPFGTGNPQPLFAFKDVRPDRVEQFGKTNDHLKLTFSTENGRLEAISFFSTPDSYERRAEAAVPVTLLAHVEESRFMGRPQIRLRIVDII